MVRSKIEMKKIENSKYRDVTFSKRRQGLVKKANELAVLCDAEVATIVYSSSGKLYDYSNKRMESILEKYTSVSTSSELTTGENDQPHEVKALKTEFAMLRQMRTQLIMGKKYKGLSSEDWKPFENQLSDVLSAIKEKKEQDMLGQIEKSRLKEESTTQENQMMLEQIKELKCKLALEKDAVDPDTSLCLGLPGTSQQITADQVEIDATQSRK